MKTQNIIFYGSIAAAAVLLIYIIIQKNKNAKPKTPPPPPPPPPGSSYSPTSIGTGYTAPLDRNKTLKYGDRSEEVKELQQKINVVLGGSPISVDGIWGNETGTALNQVSLGSLQQCSLNEFDAHFPAAKSTNTASNSTGTQTTQSVNSTADAVNNAELAYSPFGWITSWFI